MAPKTQSPDTKNIYNFFESVLAALRPILAEGSRSILIATPPRTTYAKAFIEHMNSHHKWLMQGPERAVITTISGAAKTIPEVTQLSRSSEFRNVITSLVEKETNNLSALIEERLNASSSVQLVLCSTSEIEDAILTAPKTGEKVADLLLLTNQILEQNQHRTKIQRLIQIAANKKIKTRVIDAKSETGKRLAQLGGIVLLLKSA